MSRFAVSSDERLERVWTVPNAFTLTRLLCLPLFLYLLFGRDNRAGAAWLLGGLGATDWVDGYLARRLNQVSEFGKKFDPTVDRLLLMFAVPGFMLGASDFPGNDGFQIAAFILGIPGLVLSWMTAIAYVPRIRAGIAAGGPLTVRYGGDP